MVRSFLCGLARGPSLWPGVRIFLWPGAWTFSVARREGLLCGQAKGLSVWSGARHFSVARGEAFLCGQARGPSLWSDAGTLLWSGANPVGRCVDASH